MSTKRQPYLLDLCVWSLLTWDICLNVRRHTIGSSIVRSEKKIYIYIHMIGKYNITLNNEKKNEWLNKLNIMHKGKLVKLIGICILESLFVITSWFMTCRNICKATSAVHLTHCGLVTPCGIKYFVNIGSGNVLMPDGTKPLHDTMLTYRPLYQFQWNLNQNTKKILSRNFIWKCCLQNGSNFVQASLVNSLKLSDAHMHQYSNHHWFR